MTPCDADLMLAFEKGEHAGPATRGAILLALLRPDLDAIARGAMALGDRDRALWSFKTRRFGKGSAMLAKAQCKTCDEWISLSLGEGFDLPSQNSSSAPCAYAGKTWELRLPTQADLLRAEARRGQLDLTALAPEAPWDDPAFLALAETALDDADPAIDIVFDLACPECGTLNACGFDVVDFVWRDIEALAHRLFAEVSTLARAFGWSEAETLSLTPRRRSRYVEMVT